MIDCESGTQFYYADRNKKEPVKCEVLEIGYGYPMRIIAKREDTGEVFQCYDGFGCYTLQEYDKAFADAQIQEDRIIY